MFNKIFNSKTKTLTFAAFLIGFSTGLSGLLGFVRDRLLASRLGAGPASDIYFAAFCVPDLIYALLVLGGISIAFLPLLAEAEKKKKTWQFANNVLNCFLALFIILASLLFLFTPLLINFIVPGFSGGEKNQVIGLARIMFLSPILLGTSAIFSGILQHFQKFFAFAIAPILYNLAIIFSVIVFLPRFGLKGLAWGVILGASLHLLVQIFPARASGFHHFPVFNFGSGGLKKLFGLMIPGMANQAVLQLNLIFITALASTLASGSITIFTYADRLRSFPISVVGLSFALASFPFLSRSSASGQKERFQKDFLAVVRQILFLAIPASLLLFLLRAQVVRLVLGGGKWGWWETQLTAASLGLFCLGIFAASLIPLLSRAFFSFKDTKTPFFIGVVSVGLNIVLALLFVLSFSSANLFSGFLVRFLKVKNLENIQVIAIPLALSFSQVFQFSLLLAFLKKRLPGLELEKIVDSLKKILLASFLMIIFSYFALKLGAFLFGTRTVLGLFSQTVLTGLVGILVYVFVSSFLKSPELKSMILALKQR